MMSVLSVSHLGLVSHGLHSEVEAEELVWDMREDLPGIVVAAVPVMMECSGKDALVALIEAVALISLAETWGWEEGWA